MVALIRPAWLLLGAAACVDGPAQKNCGSAPEAPPDLPAFALTTHRPADSFMTGNHVLLNQNSGALSWAATLDACGNHVWWVSPENPDNRIYRAKSSRDSASVLVGEKNRDGEEDTGWIRRLDTAGETHTRTRTLEAHHDFEERDDGDFVFLSHQYKQNIWLPQFSEDLASDVVRRVPEETEEAVDDRVFSLFDDTGIPPEWICDHMYPSNRVPGFGEWSHSNSLILDREDDDALYVLIRYWDAIVKLSRAGDVQWYLGGPRDDFTVIGHTTMPRHAHMSEVWPGGMLVFDNRNHEDAPSRVVEYAIDEEARTIQEVFSIEEPDGERIGFLGDARRLPGGNVLVSWSTKGRLSEYNRAGDLVWEVETEGTVGRIQWLSHWPGAD